MEIKDAGDAREVRANCSIHEPRKQGHVTQTQHAVFGVGPRPGLGFEQFHGCADGMKQKDHDGLRRLFQFEPQHGNLDCHCTDEQRIITRNR